MALRLLAMTWRRHPHRALLSAALGAACLSLGMCAHDSHVPPASPSSPPSVASMAPISGSVGAGVVVTGEGFTATNNTIRFGAGYINGLASSDGVTLRFTIPEGQNLCPPDGADPCAAAYPRVGPGPYSISVMNANGISNVMTFTVIAQ